MSHVEALRELARFSREARANFMVRLQGVKQEIFVTLHPPGQALLEAALASPAKARTLEPEWLKNHLINAYVEIQSRQPIESLDGDTSNISMRDDQNRSACLLYMMVRTDSYGWTYRFYFDPQLFHQYRDQLQIRFQLPIGQGMAWATWHLQQSVLQNVYTLPLLYLMARSRAVRQARWWLISGKNTEAKALLKKTLACAPDLKQAHKLLQVIDTLKPLEQRSSWQGMQIETLALSRAKLASSAVKKTLPQIGHDLLRELMLRAALLSRLTVLSRAGLFSERAIKRAQTTLKEGARRLANGDIKWGLPFAIVEFDRLLATIFADALDGTLHERTGSVKMLVFTGGPAIPPQEIQVELDQRLVLANQRLVPRWVRGPKEKTTTSGQVLQLLELKPVLQAETLGHKVIVKLHRRLGGGWLHLGLPALRYSISFADHGAEYWRTKLSSIRSIEKLKPIAKIMLQREIYGPDAAVAGLAMKGLVQLQGDKAIPTLLALARKGPADRRGHAILALALLRNRDITAVVKEAATAASSPRLRAAAMEALGTRGLPEEASLLRRGLEDRHPTVATAALIGLLRIRDRVGIKTAKQWLSDSDVKRREVLLAQLGPLSLDLRALSNDLLRLSQRAPSASVVVALVKVLGDRAVKPLSRLYKNVPALRSAIINSVSTSQAFGPLLRRAAEEKKNPVLRHLALAKLAYIKPPPRELFQHVINRDKDTTARLAAHVGLARLGRASSLLSLGVGARGRCIERRMVIPTLAKSMDQKTRSELLKDALLSPCDKLYPLIWDQILRYEWNNPTLLVAAMAHPYRALRLKGALVVLGLRTGAVLGHPR